MKPQSIHTRKVNVVLISTQHGGIQSFLCGASSHGLPLATRLLSFSCSLLFFCCSHEPTTIHKLLALVWTLGASAYPLRISRPLPPVVSPPGPGTMFRDWFERATVRPKSHVIVTLYQHLVVGQPSLAPLGARPLKGHSMLHSRPSRPPTHAWAVLRTGLPLAPLKGST